MRERLEELLRAERSDGVAAAIVADEPEKDRAAPAGVEPVGTRDAADAAVADEAADGGSGTGTTTTLGRALREATVPEGCDPLPLPKMLVT